MADSAGNGERSGSMHNACGPRAPSILSAGMPTLSTFYGIVIRMYYSDHAPPHFHALYGEHEVFI